MDPMQEGSNWVEKPDAEFWSLTETAVYLGVSPSTLYNWAYRGDTGPRSYKVGRRRKYRRVDVDTWLEQHVDNGESIEPGPRGGPGSISPFGVRHADGPARKSSLESA
jgi:excisionase family DNA binding protein